MPKAKSPKPKARFGRGSLLVLATIVLAAALLAWLWVGRSARPDGPIILISIDTLRADHLPIHGYRKIKTPNIDALAADAIVFERAYSHSPQTLPAHASILSGRLPFEHGVRDNVGFAVRPNERLLSHMLHDAGYATAGVVSAYVLRKETGIGSGFDLFDAQMPTASPEMSIGQVQRDGADSEALAERWTSGLTSPKFFLFLHLYEPHKPYTPPPRYRGALAYDGEIEYADELVGRLLGTLRVRNLYESATIVLLSDHGEGLGDHGEQEHGVFIYDESIHVPLVVKLPAGVGRGRRVAEPVQHIDLVPTLLDLAGAPAKGLRGRSLRPLLTGQGRISEQGLYAEALYPRYHFGWSELYALTDARYRFIKAPATELYDLQQDPDERRNLAAERAQTGTAMQLALERLLAGASIDRPSQVSGEERERLQALGYVGMQTEVPSSSAESLPDPKSKVQTLERYRRAVDLVGRKEFAEAVTLFRQILDENPAMRDVWLQLANVALRAGDDELALEAYKQMVTLAPAEPNGLLGVASVLLKMRRLDEAEAHAELAAKSAGHEDPRSRATAYELLAKVALKRKDREAALKYARLAQEADPSLPMPTYVEGLLNYGAERYEDALRFFLETERLLQGRSLTLTELHYYTGDALGRLGRYAEAEREFAREIALFPQNARARASLAMLYRSEGRDAEAERTIADLLRASPTIEGYGLVVRLWTIFGEPHRAEAVRQVAAREFPGQDLRRVQLAPQ